MKKKKNISLMVVLLFIGTVPLLVSIIINLMVTLKELEESISEETILRLQAVAYDAKNYFGPKWDSWIEGDPALQDYSFVDGHIESGVEVTISKGDTRYLSSIKDSNGKRLSGTKVDEDIVQTVYVGGQDYFAQDVNISGVDYFVYYTPIRNKDNNIVGMIFCGEKMTGYHETIAKDRNKLLSAAAVIVGVFFIIIIFIARKLKVPFTFLDKALESLAAGNLNTSFDCPTFLRESENMLGSGEKLQNVLRNIVGSIQTETMSLNDNAEHLIVIADNTNSNIDSCNSAVSDVAKGAVTSAADTERIAFQCSELEQISGNVDKAVEQMETSAKEALRISSDAKQTMTDLEKISGETQDIVGGISDQMEAVNSRLADVGTIVTAIADITAQTNLLSLNASIEAARAGDAGKGFAVVAGEIRKLADSSADNANQINEIITGLVNEIQRTTELTERLVNESAEEVRQLNATGEQLDRCIKEISAISDNVDKVNDQTHALGEATIAINDSVTNLSAVTEENSASAEQTSATMNESSEQVARLNEDAKDVAAISGKIKELMSFFRE